VGRQGARSPRARTPSSGHGPSAPAIERDVQQVVAALIASGRGYPDIQLVAGRMGTSVRTIQRRLHATGATYTGVVQQARCAAALQMLHEDRRRISDIARVLGYSDPAHFTRAFQHWTGVTPREFRRRG
jgi:AraC-like DNA-binding protein